jgi:hypothetical protein
MSYSCTEADSTTVTSGSPAKWSTSLKSMKPTQLDAGAAAGLGAHAGGGVGDAEPVPGDADALADQVVARSLWGPGLALEPGRG